jgi:hypothetical protein
MDVPGPASVRRILRDSGSAGGFFSVPLYDQNAANWTGFDSERAINTAELTIAKRSKRSLQARRSRCDALDDELASTMARSTRGLPP